MEKQHRNALAGAVGHDRDVQASVRYRLAHPAACGLNRALTSLTARHDNQLSGIDVGCIPVFRQVTGSSVAGRSACLVASGLGVKTGRAQESGLTPILCGELGGGWEILVTGKQAMHAGRWRVISLLILALAVAHCALVGESRAQITLDGSLGPKQALVGPNFTIDSTMGQIRGPNLFHSFGQFNIQRTESATFTNSLAGPISNILGRVTGGERSFVDGLLRSSIAGANLYLLNPSGFMFGPNAVLDVSGSFHVSTADYLRLADGGTFQANLQNASALTVAPPAAFGFLNPSPAAISFDRTVLAVPQGKTLSVIGGDVQLVGSTLRSQNGLVQIASVASAGEVVPSAAGQALDLDTGTFARLGQIQLSEGANVTTSSVAGAGTVLIRGGRLMVDNAFLNANTNGAGNGAAVGIDVRIKDDAVFTNGAEVLHFSFGTGR